MGLIIEIIILKTIYKTDLFYRHMSCNQEFFEVHTSLPLPKKCRL